MKDNPYRDTARFPQLDGVPMLAQMTGYTAGFGPHFNMLTDNLSAFPKVTSFFANTSLSYRSTRREEEKEVLSKKDT